MPVKGKGLIHQRLLKKIKNGIREVEIQIDDNLEEVGLQPEYR
jgi:hypothetical protein